MGYAAELMTRPCFYVLLPFWFLRDNVEFYAKPRWRNKVPPTKCKPIEGG